MKSSTKRTARQSRPRPPKMNAEEFATIMSALGFPQMKITPHQGKIWNGLFESLVLDCGTLGITVQFKTSFKYYNPFGDVDAYLEEVGAHNGTLPSDKLGTVYSLRLNLLVPDADGSSLSISKYIDAEQLTDSGLRRAVSLLKLAGESVSRLCATS